MKQGNKRNIVANMFTFIAVKSAFFSKDLGYLTANV